MITRRSFLKTAAAGAAGLAYPGKILASRARTASDYFQVHQFIENHPEAVFIIKTNVDEKTNSEAKKQVGLDFGSSVFTPATEGGYPVSSLVAIKPNLKTASFYRDPIAKMGVDTDAYFVEGVIESMKSLGLAGDQFHIKETHCRDFNDDGISKNWIANGYLDVAERTGADLTDMSPGINGLPSEAINYTDVPDGVFFKKIPHLWPINEPDSFLLNISKLKAHGMGLTVCCKNMQGSVAQNHQAFCSGYNTMSLSSQYVQGDALSNIQANFSRHYSDIPRWDKPGKTWNSGIGMETWVHRTLDNISTMNFGLCVIEGIYGRDGDGNSGGPNPEGNINNKSGEAWDHMTNVLIFGKNPVHVDIIGFKLAGHEAGNVGLFHIAMERGMSKYLNPESIPLYLWEDGAPVLTPLSSFEQTPLLTYSLTRDYSGQTENYWHLLDEPFDYSTVGVAEQYTADKPQSFVLHQNSPNPFNPTTTIEYSIPESGNVRMEIFNSSGQRIDVLVDGYMGRGAHAATLNASNQASGLYYYRFRFGGYSEARKMVLVR